jgi:hypothetical protein
MELWIVVSVVTVLVLIASVAWARELTRQGHARAARLRGRRASDLSEPERKDCATCRLLEQQLESAELELVRHRSLHQRMGEAAKRQRR